MATLLTVASSPLFVLIATPLCAVALWGAGYWAGKRKRSVVDYHRGFFDACCRQAFLPEPEPEEEPAA